MDAFLSYFGLSKDKEKDKEKVEKEEEERELSISMEELNARIEELTGAIADTVVNYVLEKERGGKERGGRLVPIGVFLNIQLLAPLVLQSFLLQLFAFLQSALLIFPWLIEEASGSGSGEGSGCGSGSGNKM